MAFCGRAMLALLVILGVHSAVATQYTVGGNAGWTYQQNSNTVYDDQFKSIKLFVGDALFFPFIAPTHNVYEIPPSDAPTCSFANPIQTFVTSNPIIALTTPGVHAYACEVPTHCSQSGMVLTVTVEAAAPTAAPSAPPTPAPVAAPVAAPIAAPVTAPTPVPATTAPTPAPTTKAPAPAPLTPAPSPKRAPSPKAPTPSAGPSTGSEPGTGAPAPSPAGSPGSSSGSMMCSGSAMAVAAIVAGFAVLLI